MTASLSEALTAYGEEVATAVGGTLILATDTVKVSVPASQWRGALEIARDRFGLIFFSWLSATDWSNDPAVGEPVQDTVEERFEVLCTVADLSEGRRVTFSADLSKDAASIASLVSVYPGANWHEREAHEMFGIGFDGHPDLGHLYLPDGFIGQPMLKTYRLLSRDVKPWPGDVDVEGMPGADEEEEETGE